MASKSEHDAEQGSIVDDFMYGSNVAQAHIYVRMGFLRKVYGILSAQLILTVLAATAAIVHEPIKFYIQQNHWMLLLALLGTLAIIFPLMIKRHETPLNYILLFLFTVMEAYSVSVIVTFYDLDIIIEAFALTFAVTFGLTLYTLQSRRDFSAWGASLFSLIWILIVAGFLQLAFQSALLDKAMAVGGAVLFSLFIVYDTHMLMHKLSPEEYIVASVNLYLDIINLFLHLLRLLGEARRS